MGMDGGSFLGRDRIQQPKANKTLHEFPRFRPTRRPSMQFK